MKSIIGRAGVLVLGLLIALPALGTIPVRGTSRNGENGSAQFWAMFGPTQLVTLTKGTAIVNYKLQVVCPRDRKSTRLNSSHGYISYAVFCLKKKNKAREPRGRVLLSRCPSLY